MTRVPLRTLAACAVGVSLLSLAACSPADPDPASTAQPSPAVNISGAAPAAIEIPGATEAPWKSDHVENVTQRMEANVYGASNTGATEVANSTDAKHKVSTMNGVDYYVAEGFEVGAVVYYFATDTTGTDNLLSPAFKEGKDLLTWVAGETKLNFDQTVHEQSKDRGKGARESLVVLSTEMVNASGQQLALGYHSGPADSLGDTWTAGPMRAYLNGVVESVDKESAAGDPGCLEVNATNVCAVYYVINVGDEAAQQWTVVRSSASLHSDGFAFDEQQRVVSGDFSGHLSSLIAVSPASQ